tara:strand:+ start:1627 stop:2337 length:711 start_codon:yes stop_codon:yes gene_type:complete
MNIFDSHHHIDITIEYKTPNIRSGYDLSDFLKQQDKKRLVETKLALGLHPWFVHEQDIPSLEKYQLEWSKSLPEADFIGEIGLDFSDKYKSSRQKQELVFEMLIRQTTSFHGGYILHLVKSENVAINILKKYGNEYYGFVHSFRGNSLQMQEFISLGFLISLGPNILLPMRDSVKQMIRDLPLDSLLIESDAHHAEEQSELLNQVARHVSSIKDIPVDDLVHAANDNHKRLVNLVA